MIRPIKRYCGNLEELILVAPKMPKSALVEIVMKSLIFAFYVLFTVSGLCGDAQLAAIAGT